MNCLIVIAMVMAFVGVILRMGEEPRVNYDDVANALISEVRRSAKDEGLVR